jgi:two-component system nitrate/nitrite response regulator NarL
VPAAPIRVIVAEDHPLYRHGPADAIRARTELCLVVEAADGREARAQIQEHQPDVAVLDVKMPQLDGLQALHAIRRDTLDTQVILLSAFVDAALVHQALSAGAAGFCPRRAPELGAARRSRSPREGRWRWGPRCSRRWRVSCGCEGPRRIPG